MNSARHLAAPTLSISIEDVMPAARVRLNSRTDARHRAIYNPLRDFVLSRAAQAEFSAEQLVLVAAPVTSITKPTAAKTAAAKTAAAKSAATKAAAPKASVRKVAAA